MVSFSRDDGALEGGEGIELMRMMEEDSETTLLYHLMKQLVMKGNKIRNKLIIEEDNEQQLIVGVKDATSSAEKLKNV